MDGYAVRADDVATAGAVLEVIGDIPAGGVAAGSVGPGQAFKIMTGAPMPDGADTVVRVEDTSETEGRVTIRQAYESGTYVRPRGGDVTAGDVVISGGTRLGPQHVGMMAALGVVEAIVSRRPRVAVLSTGDELARRSACSSRGPSGTQSADAHGSGDRGERSSTWERRRR